MNAHSFERRAAQRNRAVARRNQKIKNALPLFEHADILNQVAQLDQRKWSALALAYDDIGRAMASYQHWLERDRADRKQYAMYIQMLDEAIKPENREEVIADYEERWRGHTPMQSMAYRINYLNNYTSALPKAPAT